MGEGTVSVDRGARGDTIVETAQASLVAEGDLLVELDSIATATQQWSAPADAWRVVVIGRPDVQLAVASVAARGNWYIAASIEPDDDGAIPDVPAMRRLTCDEVVVQADLLCEVRRCAPYLLEQAATLRLVHPGDLRRRAESPADPFGLPLVPAARAAKRAIDIMVSLLALLLLLPAVLFAAIAVRLDSPGPVIFRQPRVGAGGKVFRILKFRTMHAHTDQAAHERYLATLIGGGADGTSGVYKLVDDPRITRIGAILRRFSLDEVPQFWNVLRGEMSVVGPRPDVLSAAELYDDVTWGRLRVKPGVTGPWQVNGRAVLDYHQMVHLDNEYAETWSIATDLRILAKTPQVVLSGRGAV